MAAAAAGRAISTTDIRVLAATATAVVVATTARVPEVMRGLRVEVGHKCLIQTVPRIIVSTCI